MNSRVLQVALKIALLQEEFSEEEIIEAVKLLDKHSSSKALLEYLSLSQTKPSKSKKTEERKTKRIEEQRSKIVLELEKKDPEKYQVLSEFDALVRKGEILPELDDIKSLGEKFSKDFPTPKSRREAISKLMSLIAQLSLEEIQDIVSQLVNLENLEEKRNDYQELAKFIIEGK